MTDTRRQQQHYGSTCHTIVDAKPIVEEEGVEVRLLRGTDHLWQARKRHGVHRAQRRLRASNPKRSMQKEGDVPNEPSTTRNRNATVTKAD